MAGRDIGDPTALLQQLPPRSAALFSWCCDVCAAIVAREAENCMNLTAVATVMAPGLVRPPADIQQPTVLLDYSKAAVSWLETCLHRRASSKEHGNTAYFPIRLGYASNVHKVQGDEFDHVTIWLDVENMPAAGYAALSRVKDAKNYLIGGKVTRKHFVPAF